MSLDSKDLDAIEHLVYKNADDIALSIARGFERLQEGIDATEARLYGRLGELEGQISRLHHEIEWQSD
jgi:hypothetical protein